MLDFDPIPHVYTWNGVRVPSVTQILAPLTSYDMIPPAVLEHAREEGVQIHRLIELDCAGDLDIDDLPAWISPYWDVWRKFKADTGFNPFASEKRMFHTGLRYAGTCDLVCTLPLLKGVKGLALIDVKRSLYAGDVIGLQLAGYAQQWDEARLHADRIKYRFAFQPRKDGTYRLEEYGDPTDRMTFNALLLVHKWRQAHAK